MIENFGTSLGNGFYIYFNTAGIRPKFHWNMGNATPLRGDGIVAKLI